MEPLDQEGRVHQRSAGKDRPGDQIKHGSRRGQGHLVRASERDVRQAPVCIFYAYTKPGKLACFFKFRYTTGLFCPLNALRLSGKYQDSSGKQVFPGPVVSKTPTRNSSAENHNIRGMFPDHKRARKRRFSRSNMPGFDPRDPALDCSPPGALHLELERRVLFHSGLNQVPSLRKGRAFAGTGASVAGSTGWKPEGTAERAN